MKKNIRCLIFLATILIIGRTGWTQNVPDWYNEENRRMNYPDNVYYTGIAYSEISSTSQEGMAVQKAEQAAKAEALSKILVSVESRTTSSTISTAFTTNNGIDEQFVEQFSSLTNTNAAFKDVPGLQVQHWKNEKKITAFAYVKKMDLARYYDRKIIASLSKVETILDNAEELIRNGEKIKAHRTALTAVQHVAELENAQRILLAVSNNADLQSEATSTLTKRLVSLLSKLKNSTSIYLDCKAYSQNKIYHLFSNELKGKLSELGCNFVNDRSLADWIISIETDIVRENHISGAYFVWIDGAVAIRNNAKKQVIFNEQISSISNTPDGIKGGHTAGYAQASAKAYNEVAKIVGNKISEILKQ